MKYDITPELFRKVSGASGSKKVIDGLVTYLPDVMDQYEINTRLRIAHFLGQLAHESDHFRTLQEYATGEAYEGRRDLGNIKRGDGRRYKGRGAIQLTGRFNYRKYGSILGADLENNPELASTPEISAKIAGEFWNQNNLNEWADKDNIKVITRRINGGYNGLQDRIDKVNRAKQFLVKKSDSVAPSVITNPVKLVEQPKQEPKKIESTLPFFAQLDLEQNSES